MSREDYEEYKDGFEEGEEVAGDDSWSGAAQNHIDVWMGRYSGKSEMWWRGFEDGKEGGWDPPDEEEEEEEQEAEGSE